MIVTVGRRPMRRRLMLAFALQLDFFEAMTDRLPTQAEYLGFWEDVCRWALVHPWH